MTDIRPPQSHLPKLLIRCNCMAAFCGIQEESMKLQCSCKGCKALAYWSERVCVCNQSLWDVSWTTSTKANTRSALLGHLQSDCRSCEGQKHRKKHIVAPNSIYSISSRTVKWTMSESWITGVWQVNQTNEHLSQLNQKSSSVTTKVVCYLRTHKALGIF